MTILLTLLGLTSFVLLALTSLSLVTIVIQLGQVLELLETWQDDDDDDEGIGCGYSYTPDPDNPDMVIMSPD